MQAVALDPMRFAYTPSETRSSGATLRHVHNPALPLVYLRLVFPVGWLDDAQLPGIAALTAWALLEGAVGPDTPTSRTHGIEQLADVRIRILPNATIFSATVLSRDVDEFIEHLQKMVLQPAFRTLSFRRAQGRSALLPSEGAEWKQSVWRIEAWQCRAFHKARYQSDGAVVVLVGDVSAEQARSLTDRLFVGNKPLNVRQPAASHPFELWTESMPTDGDQLVEVALVAPLEGGRPRDGWSTDWPALWVVAKAIGSDCSPLPWVADSVAFRVCKTLRVSQIEEWAAITRKRLENIAAHGLAPAVVEAAKREIVEDEARRLSDPGQLADTLSRWDPLLINGLGDRMRLVADTRNAVSWLLVGDRLRLLVVAR